MHPNEATLNEYADGSLGAAERAGVEQHLAACASCRQLVDDLRDILCATGDLEPLDAPVRAWPRLERAIRMEREHTTRLMDEPRSSQAVTAPAGAVAGTSAGCAGV